MYVISIKVDELDEFVGLGHVYHEPVRRQSNVQFTVYQVLGRHADVRAEDLHRIPDPAPLDNAASTQGIK